MQPALSPSNRLTHTCVAATIACSLWGCSYGKDGPSHLVLGMQFCSPTGCRDDEPPNLTISRDGSYETWPAHGSILRGTLSEQQWSELDQHINIPAAISLLDSSADIYPCVDEHDDDAYFVMVRSWLMCIVPEEVTGEAKEHIDYLVSLFNELTSAY